MVDAAPRIVRLTGPIFPAGAYEKAVFAAHGWAIEEVGGTTADVIAPHVGTADIVSVVGTPIPAALIDAMPRCRAIARLGAGTDKIDVAHATARGIVVMNTPDFCIEEQADHAMAMLLTLARKLPAMQTAIEAGDYAAARRGASTNLRLSLTTLGLVGFGRSAVHMARRARGFGMRVLATRRNRHAPTTEADAIGVVMTDLDTVLRESDFVSLHLPLTPASRHLIDARTLRLMKPGAYLINTSRGALIDEDALGVALRLGRLAGAGLDTFASIEVLDARGEPGAHPLMGLDNVVLSPHVAAGSTQSPIDMMDAAVANVADVLAGRWPPGSHRVNPTVVPRLPLTDDGR